MKRLPANTVKYYIVEKLVQKAECVEETEFFIPMILNPTTII